MGRNGHVTTEILVEICAALDDIQNAVRNVRLSVANKGEPYLVESQKRIINQRIAEKALPISHFYIGENHSDSNFDCPVFKQMLEDIDTGCIKMFILTMHLNCDNTDIIMTR